jgi:hypothetical protein
MGNGGDRSHGRGTALFMVFLVLTALGVSGYIGIQLEGNALSSRTLGEMVGGAGTLVILPALIAVPWRIFQQRRGEESDAPFLWASITFAVLAALSIMGADPAETIASANDVRLRELTPLEVEQLKLEGIASEESEVGSERTKARSTPAPVADQSRSSNHEGTTHYVDRANRFAVTIGAAWAQVASNEPATKLLLVPFIGQRCWVTVADNPQATEAIVPQIVSYLVSHPELLQRALERIYARVVIEKPIQVTLAGRHPAALFRYSGRYTALDSEITVSGVEAHIPVARRTYRVGCSTTENRLDPAFAENVNVLLRTFQIIP